MSLARRVSQKKPKLPSTGFRDSWVADLPLPPDGVKWQWNETIERGLGVALRISHHGTRSWKAVTYDGANKPVPVTVGAWPEMNTQAAKEAARCHRLNPRSHQQAKDAGTWAETCERYLAAIEAEGKHTTHQIKTKLARYVLPSWGTRRFVDIMGSDLTLLLDEIPPQQRATRNSVYTTVAAVMRWQAARMDGYTPPLSKEHKKMFAGIEDRERDLSDAEIKKLWAACEQQGEFGAFCQFALLCGQRRQKIADMLWADLDGSTWRVRRTDGEKNTPKASPLPPLAMAILAKLDRSSTRVWSLSVHHSKYKAQLDAACSLEHWTLHDLRRTCRTILTDLGVRYDVGEQVLGHVVGSAVSRIYEKANKRKANPEEERKGVTERIGEALQLLADHISKLTSTPSNVVSLKTAA